MKKAVVAPPKSEFPTETLSVVETDAEAKAVATDHESHITDVTEEAHLLSVKKKSLSSVTDSDVPLAEVESDPLPSDVEEVALLSEPESEEFNPGAVMSQTTEETTEILDLQTLSLKISELETKMTELQTELDSLIHKKNKKGTKQKKIKEGFF